VHARDAAALAALAAEVGAVALPHDARRADDVRAALESAARALGGLDGVASCIGSLHLKPPHATSPEEWEEVMAVNAGTAFHIVRAAAPLLGRGGSIVLCSSAAARVGLANHEVIGAAKAAVEGLALSAAATYAPRGIRVNCVAPGLTRTPLTARLTASAASQEASAAMHPLGRVGEPGDVAAAIEWLLDPRQSWITGQVLGVDGGLSRVRARPGGAGKG